jgi:hypothetical protein
MDQPDDFERQLTSRLQPARVPSADETWRRIASQLTPRRESPHLFARWLFAAAAVAAIVVVSLLLRPTRGALPAISGGATPSITPPVSAPSSAATRTATGPRGVRVVGAGIVSVEPALPFTLWQSGYRSLSEYLVAYAYRAAGQTGMRSATVNTRGDGRDLDPASKELATNRALALIDTTPGAAMVLVYVADPSQVGVGNQPPAAAPPRLFAVVQGPVTDPTLPPGEAAWFSDVPATFVRQDDGVVLSWIAGDTAFVLYSDQSPEEAVVFAGSLNPTALVAPETFVPAPTPTLTLPTIAPPRTPRTPIAPCATNQAVTGARGMPLICPSNPSAPAGMPTFDESDVRRQLSLDEPYIGPFARNGTATFASLEFLRGVEVSARLKLGTALTDDQLFGVVTITGDFILPSPDPLYPPTAYNAVILVLDGRTGNQIVATGTRP